MKEEADPMYGGHSQMELFFMYGEDIRVEEKDGKIVFTARFKIDPNFTWVGTYGSNE